MQDILLNGDGMPARPTGNGGAKPAPADVIKESDSAHFMADVIEASRDMPVIVDFWATWCGPCKTLGPMLEKAVAAAGGAVRMVKIDVDRNPEISAQLRIQSIPTVYAFYQGQPVDGFQGALPESQIKAFIDKLIEMSGGQSPAEDLAAVMEQAAALLADGDAAAAANLYAKVLEADPENAVAIGALARAYLALGEGEAAKEMIEGLSEALKLAAPVQAALSAIELAAQAGESAGKLAGLHEAVAANPKDHQARIDLAMALYATGDREGAVDQLLESISIDRAWNEEAARKQLVKLFDAFGPTDPLTVASRRRLSSILFS
ncbi:MAG: thioredoxin [Rhodospirillales bacterium]